jgi:MFS family permease
MTDRARHIFYMIVFPLGHFSVDTPGGALWLLAPAAGLTWGLSPAEVGFIITAHNLGAGLGYLPAGLMGDRFRARGLLLMMSVWWVIVGYLVASLAPNYWVFVGLLALAGAGDAAWHPMATGTLVQHMPERRAMALGVHLTGGVMAEVLAPLAVGFLLAVFDWRTVLQIAVIPALLMGTALLYFHRYIEPSNEPAISRADIRFMAAVWRKPAGMGMFGLSVAYSMSFVALLAMSPLFLQDYHGFSSARTGVIFAVMLLGGGFLAPLLGRWSDVGLRKRLTVGSLLTAGAGALLAAFAGSTLLLVLGLVVSASLLMGVRPIVLAAALEMVGRRQMTSLGLIYAVMDGLGALGGLLAGLAGSSDLRYAIVFAAATAALSGVAALLHPFSVAGLEPATPNVTPRGAA